MSRNRGLDLQNGLARYLRQWWPGAESAGAGRPGRDVLGVPGVGFENKTADEFSPLAFVRQAKEHVRGAGLTDEQLDALPADCLCGRAKNTRTGLWELVNSHGCQVCHYDIPVVVYWPRGVGEKNAGNTLSIVPTEVMVRLLKQAGY